MLFEGMEYVDCGHDLDNLSSRGDIPANTLAAIDFPMSIRNIVSKRTLCRSDTPILVSQGSQKRMCLARLRGLCIKLCFLPGLRWIFG